MKELQLFTCCAKAVLSCIRTLFLGWAFARGYCDETFRCMFAAIANKQEDTQGLPGNGFQPLAKPDGGYDNWKPQSQQFSASCDCKAPHVPSAGHAFENPAPASCPVSMHALHMHQIPRGVGAAHWPHSSGQAEGARRAERGSMHTCT